MWLAAIAAVPAVEGIILLAAESPTQDPITFFVGQGVLGLVSYLIYREYKDEKKKREELTDKLINDLVPLLARGTEAMERLADAEARRPKK